MQYKRKKGRKTEQRENISKRKLRSENNKLMEESKAKLTQKGSIKIKKMQLKSYEPNKVRTFKDHNRGVFSKKSIDVSSSSSWPLKYSQE